MRSISAWKLTHQIATFLKRLESITVNKIVVSVDVMYLSRIILLAHSDGSVHYRDRGTMEETFNDGNLNEVWHLSQIGFTYPEDEPCKWSAFVSEVLLT